MARAHEDDNTRPDRQHGDKLAGAAAKASAPPAAHLTTEDKKLDRTEDATRESFTNPTTGRNSKLGRRVEKPADPKAGGPSGQKDRAKHNKRHANK
jgi:hypothetical protein